MMPHKPTLADVYSLLEEVHHDVRGLRDLSRGAPWSLLPTPAAGPPDLDALLQRTLREVNARGQHGGLVPLPALRRALSPQGVARTALDQALLQGERDRKIELKTANDPTMAPDAQDGLPVPGRGLLYYVVVR